MIVLYILLFIFCLSVLIVVHELGHLSMAKAFKVYCLEFSVGFGPALFHRKRKNGETYFSLRAIPFGGYVSMYGEGIELEPGVVVDESRSISNIRKWKKILILFAGVFMNAILALIIFFITATCFVQQSLIANFVEVKENTIAYEVGLRTKDRIKLGDIKDQTDKYLIDGNALAYYEDGNTTKVAAVLSTSGISYSVREYSKYMKFYPYINESEGTINFTNELTASTQGLTGVNLTVTKILKYDAEKQEIIESEDYLLVDPVISGAFTELGLSMYLYEHWNNFGEALQQTFVSWGNSATAIFKGIGSLFTDASSWNNVGGIIYIGVETTNILKTLGVAQFLNVWGLISVNLAIINLLPFPGLDGWQILVTAIEGIFHKEIPEKVKNIISFVGIAILMVLMVLIVIKDIIRLV